MKRPQLPAGWPSPTTCRDCGVPALWTRTAKDRAMLVELDVSDHGNVLVSLHGGKLHAGVLGKAQAAAARDYTGLRLAHAVNCPGPRGAQAASQRGRS